MATRKPTPKTSPVKPTKLVISGSGLAFSVLDIDRETFTRFTRTGITDDEFEDLKNQLTDAGDCITAPFLDDTTVSINGKKYKSSWDNIKAQCGNVMPAATKIYKVPKGTYSVIMEVSYQGEFVKAEIPDFDPMKLRFDLERIELAKGREYALLDPYYNNDFLEFGKLKATGVIYVVDGSGKQFDVKRAD